MDMSKVRISSDKITVCNRENTKQTGETRLLKEKQPVVTIDTIKCKHSKYNRITIFI